MDVFVASKEDGVPKSAESVKEVSDGNTGWSTQREPGADAPRDGPIDLSAAWRYE